MRVEEFSSFLNLENNDMAEALRRLQEEEAADRLGGGETLSGWSEW